MTDISRLETALISADAAGDVEAATALAGALRSARTAAQQSAPSGSSDAVSYSSDAVSYSKQIASGLGEGVAGLVGLPGMASRGMDWLVEKAGAAVGYPAPSQNPDRQPRVNLLPQPSQVQGAIEGVTGKFPEPQGRGERYVRTAASFLPGAMMGPGGAVRNAAMFGAVPGVVSEAVGELTKGTALEPWARGGAALTAGIVGGVATAPGNVGGAVNRAVGGADRATLQQAEGLFQEAQAMGMPITRAEAIQAVTGGATNFGNLQRVVEGQGGMREFFAARAPSNNVAAGRTFDQVTPAAPNPSAIGPAVGTAAENTINDVRGVINAASDQFYQQAASVRIPGSDMARVRTAPGWAEARDAVRNDPQLDRYVRNLPENSIGFLNEVKKYLGTAAENAASPVNQQRNMQRSAGYGFDEGLVRDTAVAASRRVPTTTGSYGGQQFVQHANPYETALNIQSTARERYLQPLLDGPLGKIAAKDTTTQKAIDVLFPNSPLPNSADELATAISAVSKRNPYAARQLVRAHLEMTFNEATQNLASGANSFGGAKFAAVVRGNPQQAANLEATVRALPNGNNIWPGIDRFLTILEAQGQRQAVGSQTAFNQEVLQDLRRGGVMAEAGTMLVSGGIKLPQRIKDGIERWRMGDNVDELARLFTDPSAGREFIRLAGADNGARAMSSIVRLVGLTKTGATNQSNQAAGPKN